MLVPAKPCFPVMVPSPVHIVIRKESHNRGKIVRKGEIARMTETSLCTSSLTLRIASSDGELSRACNDVEKSANILADD